MKRSKPFQGVVIWVLVLLLAAPVLSFAQDTEGGAKKFSQEQLDQILAPIALYPDSLLAQILMAATYPLEVVMADRWVKQNRNLQGDQFNDALDNQTWDASVKGIVPFPDILSMMSEKLDWTQMVGDAFLAQESDVMATVQQLRQKAYAANNLKNSDKQQVTIEDDSIRIEPANPEVVYVPAYDPMWVYGPWWWPGYPPYVVYPYWPGVVITPGFVFFGVGCYVGVSWGHVWGHWDWGHRHVFVNENRNININRRNLDWSHIRTAPWVHDPNHRRGVPYRDPRLRERFRQINPGAVENRRPFRRFGEPGATPGRPAERPSGTVGVPGPGKRPGGTNAPDSRGKRPERTPGSPGGGRPRDVRTGAPGAALTPLPPTPPAPTGFGFPRVGERPVATTVAPGDSGQKSGKRQGASGGPRRSSEGQTGAPGAVPAPPGPSSPPPTGFGFPRI